MRPTIWALSLWLGLAVSAGAQTPQATPSPSDAPASAPKLTPSAPGAKAYFVDLKDGVVYATSHNSTVAVD